MNSQRSETTYHSIMTSCGKSNCRTCREKGGHGPYWYAYKTVDGQTKRTYIGKHLPSEVRASDENSLHVGRPHSNSLIGREDERERLHTLLHAVEKHVQRGQNREAKQVSTSPRPVQFPPQSIFVLGEAGIGKTRLAEEISREAQQDGWRVLWSHAYTQEADIPYHLWIQLFNRALATSPSFRAEVVSYLNNHPLVSQQLASLLPELQALATEVPVSRDTPDEQGQLRLWEAFRELLHLLSKQTPLLIVLDDVQWTDSASCDLLAYLARRIVGMPIVLVGTCRDNELPFTHSLRMLLSDLQREGVLERLSLQPLSDEQIEHLVSHIPHATSISQPMLRTIQTRAAGNPFFAEELARSVDEMPQVNGEQKNLPDSITAVLDLRLSQLSKECQRLLSKATVLGGSFEFPIISAMEANTSDEDTILDLLEEGLQSGMLTEEGTGTRVTYSFWHPLLVSHLYEGLSAARRASLHRRAAHVLRQSYQGREEDEAATITHHLVLGGADPQQIANYAQLAGNHSYALSAYPDAEKYYEIAVSHTSDRNGLRANAVEREKVASLLERLGECAVIQGKTEEARQYYERVLAIREHLAGDSGAVRDLKQEAELRALLSGEISWTWRYAGDTEKAIMCREQGEQVLHEAGVLDGPAWASMHYQHGSVSWQEGEYEEAQLYAQKALKLFEETISQRSARERPSASTRVQRTLLGDPVDVGRSHMLLAAIAATVGQSTEAENHLKTALALFEYYDCLHEIATICCNLGDLYLKQAAYNLAQTILERAVTIADRIGDLPNMAVGLGNLGILATRQGDFPHAEACYKRALSIAQHIDDPIYTSLLHSYIATVQRERAQFQEAHVSLSHALKIGRAIRSAPCLAFALVTLAQLRLSQALAGESERMLKRAKVTLERALAMEEVEAETRVEGELVLAQILSSLGETQKAREVAQQAREQADHYGLFWLVPRTQEAVERLVTVLDERGS